MVGSRIKDYLNENGIKQSFVANKAGLTVYQISDICNRDRTIDILIYARICRALNVPLETFISEEDYL